MKAAKNTNTRPSKNTPTKATTTEIDELFAFKGEPPVKTSNVVAKSSSGSDKMAMLKKNDDGFSDSRGGLSSRNLTLLTTSNVLIILGKRTEDGLPIYSVEELGIGRGSSACSVISCRGRVSLTLRQILPSVHLTAIVAFESSVFARESPDVSKEEAEFVDKQPFMSKCIGKRISRKDPCPYLLPQILLSFPPSSFHPSLPSQGQRQQLERRRQQARDQQSKYL